MKCNTCYYKVGFTLGADECGAGSYVENCAKLHWENSYTEPQTEKQNIEMKLNPDIDFWENCKDYKEKER